ncbi:hypothetical protein BGAL_0015g00370 [Botrytis galanthina]|uniref:Uncharacterized protein n=1 Tax=Botrytis galanthina TaxID=278940 RepID=A0A4S8RCB9_9HELO|nr:hypothetical protein BGAL_0015g00370 [Botrytis galanthina]
MVHARTFSRQLGSTLPTHNQPQIPPQIIISDSEDPHKPVYYKTTHWKNSFLNSVQSSHIKTSTSFRSLLTRIKKLPSRSKILLGLVCLLSLVSLIGVLSGVRLDLLRGGERSPYPRTHYATHNKGPKFDHNRDKGVKREEAPPIPVQAIGLTPKKVTPVVHEEGKKVKRDGISTTGLTPRKLMPRQFGIAADAMLM